MKNALKIAIYSGDIPSTTFIERLIHGLSLKGHRILLFGVIKRKTNYYSNILNAGYYSNPIAKLLYLIKYTFLISLFKYKAKSQLDKFLKSQDRNTLYSKVKYYPVLWHQPDIFHVQWAKSVSEWSWVQLFGMKLVLSLRGAHINYSPIADEQLAATYRELFPKVDGFHAVSKAIAETAQGYGAPKERIHIVYSGLDLDAIRSSKIDKTSSHFQILSVGRSHWKKGYPYALDACQLLKAAGVSFHYTIVGALGDIELAYQVADLGLDHEVSLMGQMPFKTVQRQMQDADVLVLPSVEEGIANVVLEAMALGTLVLSTDCGGMDEVIADGVNGFVVPVRDSKALAERLESISNLTPSQKALLLTNARATVANQHQASQMVTDMEALYQLVLTPQAQ